MRPTLLIPGIAALALGLLASACGGGDNGIADPSVSPGGVACDALINESYEYTVSVIIEVGEVPPGPPPTPREDRSPFRFTSEIQGKIQDGDRIYGRIINSDGANTANIEATIIDNDGYLNFGDGQGWLTSPGRADSVPFPYRPAGLCQALVPDINTTTLGSAQDESVNGIDSSTYTLTDFATAFFKAAPDFGGDAGQMITEVNGTMSIAKKGLYPSKFDFVGKGAYPSGQPLTVTMAFEASNMQGDNIKVDRPPAGTPLS